MGSQVRILYRPPSKEQVRGLEPLTFFIFETKSDSKNKFVLSESLFWQECTQGCQARSSMLQCKVFESANAEDTEFS